MRAEIPLLTLSPFSLLPWFSMDHMNVDTKGQRPVRLFECRKKTELLFNRGKGRGRQVTWAGLQGHCLFPSLHILLQACTSPVDAPFPLFLAPFSGNSC